MAQTDSRQVIYWMVFFSGANIFVKGAYSLVVLLLASVLTPSAYAGFGMLYALQGAMTMFATVGLQETASARLKYYSSELRRRVLYQRMSGLFILTMLLAFLALFPFIFLLEHEDTPLMSATFALLLGAIIGYGVLQASFQRLENRHAASLLTSAGIPLLSIVGMMVGGWWVGDLTFVFALALAGASIALFILVLRGQIFLGPLPSALHIGGELLSLGPFLVIGIFGWLSGYGMNFIINMEFKSFFVATFTFLFTFASGSQMIANSLNMAWSPRFYDLYNSGDMDQAESRSRLLFGLLAIVLGLVGFMAVALLPWLTNLMGGNLTQYGNFRLELAFLMSGYVICVAWWHGQNYYFIAGYGKELMYLSLWSGGIGLVAWILCMIVLGPMGIFAGFALQMLIKAVSMRLVGVRHWPMRPPWAAIITGCILTFAGLIFPLDRI